MQTMDQRAEEIIKAFPALQYDEGFLLTSPENPDYNCIAWAYGTDKCWMWPENEYDGVSTWPNDYTGSPDIEAFMKAFADAGYEECEDAEQEPMYTKIALYTYPHTQECTHAARQLPNGLWTSKLGSSYDIQHSTPYVIQGRLYGNVYCLMKKKMTQ